MPRLMFTIVLTALLSHSSLCQLSTLNNYTGTWSGSGSWTGGTQPNPLTAQINDEIDIYGYITREGSLSFDNLGNNTDQIRIYDTLVIEGNVTFENNAMSLSIQSGGVMIVFGDFTANNKVDMGNGGILAITGNLTLSGGQQDYVDNGGDLYVDGTISGNGDTGDADAIDQPTTSLDGSVVTGEQDLFDFINGGGSTPLPITLANFYARPLESSVELSWTTLTEENFEYFEIQRSHNGAEFEVIDYVDGHGNSTEAIDYTYIDHKPIYGISYYRLNAVDYDGSNEIFKIVSVNYLPQTLQLDMYPNPGNGDFVNFSLALPTTPKFTRLAIYNANGGLIVDEELPTAQHQVNFSNNLSPGLYIARITIDNYTKAQRMVVQ